ncbi:hypothetical protein DFH09DRAFT_1131067 [Mycena vulgaris]|nr:hypothetical protein DFH09DRAFT_1131067 [Mycena vulgaris]
MHENVRDVMIQAPYPIPQIVALLSLCTGVQTLALSGPNFHPSSILLPLQPMRLRRLILPLIALFHADSWISPRDTMFAALTHLHLHSRGPFVFPLRFALSALPALLHLCFDPPPVYPQGVVHLRNLLEVFQTLQILVCMFSSQHMLESSGVVTDEGPWIDDPPVVILVLDHSAHVEDWKLGVAGGRDFWARADDFVAKKRSDKSTTHHFCDDCHLPGKAHPLHTQH